MFRDATCSRDSGSGARDRSENVRRAGARAMVSAPHGVVVLVPVIAPYRAARDEVGAVHTAAGMGHLEV
ncbi:adenylyl-sulfate kinase [Streptomyces sp. NPDC056500]|uniref:adenylyl-sulfate kinase n=1 Tax=Streptomyces sp. NPDC056500 TaxID=3345840 RepID=UPI0036CFA5F5